MPLFRELVCMQHRFSEEVMIFDQMISRKQSHHRLWADATGN